MIIASVKPQVFRKRDQAIMSPFSASKALVTFVDFSVKKNIDKFKG